MQLEANDLNNKISGLNGNINLQNETVNILNKQIRDLKSNEYKLRLKIDELDKMVQNKQTERLS